MLFGCYRRGDANDPDTYVAAISAVLARYQPDLIREVTDPNSGIQTTEKYMSFMPNAGELKVYCEAIAVRKERLQRLGSLPAPVPSSQRLAAPPAAPGDKATVFVPASHPRYPALVEWAKTADPLEWKYETRPGIWVAYGVWDAGIAIGRRVHVTDMSRLALSDAAKRVMASVDAERNGELLVDQQAAE